MHSVGQALPAVFPDPGATTSSTLAYVIEDSFSEIRCGFDGRTNRQSCAIAQAGMLLEQAQWG